MIYRNRNRNMILAACAAALLAGAGHAQAQDAPRPAGGAAAERGWIVLPRAGGPFDVFARTGSAYNVSPTHAGDGVAVLARDVNGRLVASLTRPEGAAKPVVYLDTERLGAAAETLSAEDLARFMGVSARPRLAAELGITAPRQARAPR